MPRSSPSTSPAERDSRVVEVVELDREAFDPGLPTLGSRPNRWAILLGILVLGVLGLSLLPAAEVQPNSLDDTLPDPAVATTLVGSLQPRVAFINDDTFPMFVVSGLKGFVSLTEPVFFDGRWWIIGNRPDLFPQAVVLASEDGRLWERLTEIPVDIGRSVRIDQLTTVDGALIAVGTEGTLIGPTFYSALSGTLGLWRSEDGVRWIPGTVDPGDPTLAFTDIRLAVSGRSALLQATANSTAAASAALRLPAPLQPALSEGRLHLWPQGTRLVVLGPLGIQVDETALSQVTTRSSPRVFRSDSLVEWNEVQVRFDLDGAIVSAPEGGFVVGTGGAAFTSAYGVIWSPNPRAYDAGAFQDWGKGILGLSWEAGSQRIDLIDSEGQLAVQLPPEMLPCWVEGSNDLLAAACFDIPAFPASVVPLDGFELSQNGAWLELRNPATDEVRQFRLQVGGDFDPATDTITLIDSSGESQAIPIGTLQLLDVPSANHRFKTMLSGDGLTWSQSQIALLAARFELIGGIGDGFLVAIGSTKPGSTLTVLAADF
jgi:hypothetical protein